MAKTESKLLPCPFCGKVPVLDNGLERGAFQYVEISCTHPVTEGEDGWDDGALEAVVRCDTVEQAVRAWNLRAANSDGGVEPLGWHCENGDGSIELVLWPDDRDRFAKAGYEITPLYPPAKALDGIAVSEEMLERMMDGIMGPGWRTFNPDSVTALRNLYSIALEAALAVR